MLKQMFGRKRIELFFSFYYTPSKIDRETFLMFPDIKHISDSDFIIFTLESKMRYSMGVFF